MATRTWDAQVFADEQPISERHPVV